MTEQEGEKIIYDIPEDTCVDRCVVYLCMYMYKRMFYILEKKNQQKIWP